MLTLAAGALSACGDSASTDSNSSTVARQTREYQSAGASHKDAACLANITGRVKPPPGAKFILVPGADRAIARCHLAPGRWPRSVRGCERMSARFPRRRQPRSRPADLDPGAARICPPEIRRTAIGRRPPGRRLRHHCRRRAQPPSVCSECRGGIALVEADAEQADCPVLVLRCDVHSSPRKRRPIAHRRRLGIRRRQGHRRHERLGRAQRPR